MGSGQGERIGPDLECTDISTKRVDVGDAGHSPQSGTDGPVEKLPLLLEAERPLDREHEDIGQRRGNRRQAARHARRQIRHHSGKALRDLLARPIDICAVGEVDGDIGDRIFGGRTQDRLPGNAQHLHLDRGNYAALNLLRRHAGSLENDLDLRLRYIGIRIHG